MIEFEDKQSACEGVALFIFIFLTVAPVTIREKWESNFRLIVKSHPQGGFFLG